MLDRGRQLLAALGRPLVSAARAAAQTAGFGWAVLEAAVRPATWRRPVRAEFLSAMLEAGVGAVRPTVIAAVLIGLAMVYQAMFWLQAAGQANLLGDVLVLVLVREIAPLLVGLILIGRSGTALLINLGMLRSGGQLRMLDASGIDPFLLLVVPRVVAFALSTFCLAIVHLVTALLVGYVAGQAVGAVRLPLYAFIDGLLAAMDARVYLLLLLKTFVIGFVVGVISARAALAPPGQRLDIGGLAANGFIGSVLASFVVSGAISLAL
jgi:phospholipid/cholesterol/gamma-HCH transport system permease protein